MQTERSTRTNPWIVFRKENAQARMRLFCLHHAGGAANAFRQWGARLPSAVEVCPVELPGHSTRMGEARLGRLEPLAAAAVEGLLPLLDRPFAFFGHSLGSLVAFQVTRLLRRRGLPGPLHLFVAARVAPSVALKGRLLHTLPDGQLVQELRSRYDAIPDEIARDPDLMALILPTIRADFEVHETYVHRPEPPLACGISVFGGTRDAMVSEAELEAWRLETDGPFSREMIEGGHFFPHGNSPRFWDVLSRGLMTLVRQVESGIAPPETRGAAE